MHDILTGRRHFRRPIFFLWPICGHVGSHVGKCDLFNWSWKQFKHTLFTRLFFFLRQSHVGQRHPWYRHLNHSNPSIILAMFLDHSGSDFRTSTGLVLFESACEATFYRKTHYKFHLGIVFRVHNLPFTLGLFRHNVSNLSGTWVEL